jgi:hypothetical protein
MHTSKDKAKCSEARKPQHERRVQKTVDKNERSTAEARAPNDDIAKSPSSEQQKGHNSHNATRVAAQTQQAKKPKKERRRAPERIRSNKSFGYNGKGGSKGLKNKGRSQQAQRQRPKAKAKASCPTE